MNIIKVKSAKYLGGYLLEVTFNDGLKKKVNLTDALTGKIFQPLRDPAFFAKFRVDDESDTIVWPNGADMAPEYLYEHGELNQNQIKIANQ